MRRAATALAVAVALLVGSGGPAAADPPRPTNDRSEVTGAEPPLPPQVEVRVVGGDAFLELSVARGTEVVVPDYGQDATADATPYLRFEADGTVRRNERSQARAVNDDRYGRTDEVPDPDAAPRWTVVARDGRYAWHDHRIHWMSPRAPQVVADDGTIDLGGPDGGWELALLVDGTPTVVTGRLVRLEAPSPWPWLALAAAVGAAGIALGRRRPRALLAVAAGTGVGAIVVSAARWLDAPPGTAGLPVAIVVSALGAAGAVAALVAPARLRPIATALAAAGLLGWAVARAAVLTNAVLPTSLPYAVDRGITAAALGVGLAVAAGMVLRSSRPA
ncbi:MAG: hypothetical protein R2702_04500 [Acidimicrobiales bacterium]